MHVILVKGPHRVRVTTSGNVVETVYDVDGNGFTDPFRHTVDDPEVLAQEYVDSYLADGWTRVEG